MDLDTDRVVDGVIPCILVFIESLILFCESFCRGSRVHFLYMLLYYTLCLAMLNTYLPLSYETHSSYTHYIGFILLTTHSCSTAFPFLLFFMSTYSIILLGNVRQGYRWLVTLVTNILVFVLGPLQIHRHKVAYGDTSHAGPVWMLGHGVRRRDLRARRRDGGGYRKEVKQGTRNKRGLVRGRKVAIEQHKWQKKANGAAIFTHTLFVPAQGAWKKHGGAGQWLRGGRSGRRRAGAL